MAGKKTDETETDETPELAPGEQAVELDEPDSDDDGPASAAPTEAERASRRDRRAQRRDRLVEESAARADAAEARAKVAEERSHRLAEAAITRPAAKAQQASDDDPLEKERSQIIKDRVTFNRRYQDISTRSAAGTATDKEIEELEQEGLELEDRVQANAYARHAKKHQPQQQPGATPQATMFQAQLAIRVPELINDAKFKRAFDYLYPEVREETGGDGWAEIDETAKRARAMLGKSGSAPKRSASELSRHVGVSRGAASSAPAGARTVVLTKEDKRMANAAYRHIKDEDERYKVFAREVKAHVEDE